MYNLDEAFDNYMKILDECIAGKNADLWTLYFQIWRYLYCLNQSIEECSRLEDKIAILTQFAKKDKELAQFQAACSSLNKRVTGEVGASDDFLLPPHIENIKELYLNENRRLNKLIKDIANQTPSLGKMVQKRRKRVSKEKWIRS